MNAPELAALAQQVAEIEATFLGLCRLLKASRPDLAPAIDDCLAAKEAGARGRKGAAAARKAARSV